MFSISNEQQSRLSFDLLASFCLEAFHLSPPFLAKITAKTKHVKAAKVNHKINHYLNQ